jgi:hypothetical protein
VGVARFSFLALSGAANGEPGRTGNPIERRQIEQEQQEQIDTSIKVEK